MFDHNRARASAGSSKASKDASLTPLRTPTMAYKKEKQMHSALTPLTEKKRNKMRSPMISSPFSLRTEERAARRKKKLEEKFNANEAQKVQLHTKLKEKAETEIRKLCQSFCFKARPLPDFYKERKESNKETQQDIQTQSESRKAILLRVRDLTMAVAPLRISWKRLSTAPLLII
ncbi:protein WVD2-like 4 [Arachis stenosperma]|uniref:protein WVD2-like 4 n=1 Tax=Arachis stenosperma TaxID=217475 RepID=UPI0025AC9088|nr:protein WVD2-like 4 [Arachis stenosperma]